VSGLIVANGGVSLGNVGTACTAATVNVMRGTATGIEYCTGIDWAPVGTLPATRTCKTIKTANAAAANGNYTLVAAGKAFAATCDMTSFGGGWTLIQSHLLGQASNEGPTVLGGSGRWLQADLVRSLALVSNDILIRRTTGTPVNGNYAISSDSYPISRLRQLKILTDDTSPTTSARHWTTAGTVTAANLNYTCTDTTVQGGSYPSIYWACNNGAGLHVLPDLNVLTLHGFINDSDGVDVWVR
jgi:hypothetical protein